METQDTRPDISTMEAAAEKAIKDFRAANLRAAELILSQKLDVTDDKVKLEIESGDRAIARYHDAVDDPV